MVRTRGALAMRLDFGERPGQGGKRSLRLATPSRPLWGPEKYRLLDLKRRRAQISARRQLGLV